MKFAHACQDLWAVLQIADLNVLLVQNVHKIVHVSIRNVLIHANRHVDSLQDAKLLITIHSVHARRAILVILSFVVWQFHVSACPCLFGDLYSQKNARHFHLIRT